MTNATPVPDFDTLEGLRVDYHGDQCNHSGEGVISRTFTKKSAPKGDYPEGFFWSYRMIEIKMDDAREMDAITFDTFQGTRFSVSENQTPLEDRQAEASLDDVMELLPSFELAPEGSTIPVNYNAFKTSGNGYHVEVCGTWWEIFDNGGELMFGRLNLGDLCQRVYLSEPSGNLTAGTVAARLSAGIRREPYDAEFRMSNEDAAVLLTA